MNSWKKRAIKRKLFGHRDQVRCCFCRAWLTFERATIEHVQPLSLGGGWQPANLRLSCSPCNHERDTGDFATFRIAKRRPEPPPMGAA